MKVNQKTPKVQKTLRICMDSDRDELYDVTLEVSIKDSDGYVREQELSLKTPAYSFFVALDNLQDIWSTQLNLKLEDDEELTAVRLVSISVSDELFIPAA